MHHRILKQKKQDLKTKLKVRLDLKIKAKVNLDHKIKLKVNQNHKIKLKQVKQEFQVENRFLLK